ncbi:MAG: SIS domain-containing protein [Anaerolineales bacterium]
MKDLAAYIKDLQATLHQLPIERVEQTIRALEDARTQGKHVFIFGNGGSASTASHFVCDLAKNTRGEGGPLFKAIGLSDNMALMTAYGNDEGYESVFAHQLANLVSKDDVVIAISTSGNSPNVLQAVEVARAAGARTIAFTGETGGELTTMSDLSIHVPSDRIEHVEDVHLILEHMITARLRSVEDPAWIQWPVIERQDLETVAADQLPIPDSRAMSASVPNNSYWRAVPNDEERPKRDRVVQRLLALSVDSVGAQSGCAVLVDEKSKPSTGYLTYQGKHWEAAGDAMEDVLEHGLAGWVMHNRQPVLIGSTAQDPRWLSRTWDSEGPNPRSVLSAPLINAGILLGVLTMVYPAANRFNEDDLAVLSAFSSGLAQLARRGSQETPLHPSDQDDVDRQIGP